MRSSPHPQPFKAGRAVRALRRTRCTSTATRASAASFQARKQAAVAADRAAALNADSGRGASYGGTAATAAASAPASDSGAGGGGGCVAVARVAMASIAGMPKEAVVDTTGAGDSFIGSCLYGLCTGLPLHATLRLAAVVAACKCTELGARQGLPERAQLAAELLG
ncbi:Ribokinase [Tetrabaena socialis]|uniref:Ribokinase n=1 Tax=Tetrabaena socialis TaxID=47790 RepID=A0A2J7ZWM5_9CHLO|nr:Ribokinase [Tetrabaena socialis]|eukprot:PNH04664.1 Ribokinase [Tetrabaena socialis]